MRQLTARVALAVPDAHDRDQRIDLIIVVDRRCRMVLAPLLRARAHEHLFELGLVEPYAMRVATVDRDIEDERLGHLRRTPGSGARVDAARVLQRAGGPIDHVLLVERTAPHAWRAGRREWDVRTGGTSLTKPARGSPRASASDGTMPSSASARSRRSRVAPGTYGRWKATTSSGRSLRTQLTFGCNEYFFILSMSVTRDTPSRRAASLWLPLVPSRARATRPRSKASTCSLSDGPPRPSADGST